MKVWLRKLFDMITAGEAPADVDAAAHRSALWIAYVTCWILFVLGVIFNLLLWIVPHASLYSLLVDPSSSLYPISNSISIIFPGTPLLAIAFFIPFFIYAFALRFRGYRIPSAVLILVHAVFLSSLLSRLLAIGGWRYREFAEIIFLTLALVVFQLVATLKRWRLVALMAFVVLLTIIIDLIVSRFTIYRLSDGFIDENLATFHLAISYVLTMIKAPVLFLLPIGLISDQPISTLQGYHLEWKSVGKIGLNALIATLALTAIYGVMKGVSIATFYNVEMPRCLSFMETPEWSILVVLLTISVTTQFIRNASKGFVAYLILIPIAMLTFRYALSLDWLPANAHLPASLLLAGLAALLLATEGHFNRHKLRAIVVFVGGCVLLWLWCWLELPRISQQLHGAYGVNATYTIFSAAIARFALLAYIPAVLFAAWWFISPKEIESLVLGKHEPATMQRDSDGAPTP